MSRSRRSPRSNSSHSARSSGAPGPSGRPYRSITSQLTFDHTVAIEAAAAAELRGDWTAAFERHRSVPFFAESHHGGLLHVLADLGDDAPRWLVTRFLTVMAHRLEMYGQPQRSGRLLQLVVPKIYPHGIPFDAMDCVHAEQVLPAIIGRDWVARQADVYDLGGLEDLLHMDGALGAVAAGEHVAEWARTPMGGYRVVGADGDVMTIADALTGQELELLDLGLTAQHPAGTHVLGRVVPTSCGPGRLFDAQPLPVDPRIAREVAARPAHWLDVLSARATSRALPEAFSHLPDASLTADLPRFSWTSLLGHAIGLDSPRPPRTMVAEALKAALTLAPDPEALAEHRYVVSELLLDELLDETMLARFASPPYLAGWQALAAALPATSRRRCNTALWMIDAVTVDDDLAG